MNFLIKIIIALNTAMNAVGKLLLAPLMTMPGWLSNAIVSAIAGVLLMLLFKYTSNQSAIGRVRDSIKAHMLVLKLFKDSIAVTLQAQGTIFKGAFLLIFYALRPMLVMILPVSLLLSQLSLFYQARPLLPGEEAIVTMQLADDIGNRWPDVKITSFPDVLLTVRDHLTGLPTVAGERSHTTSSSESSMWVTSSASLVRENSFSLSQILPLTEL